MTGHPGGGSGLSPWRIYWVGLALVALAWAVCASWLVPWVIRGAYSGESISFLNDRITGQSQHPVEDYLDTWFVLAWVATIALAAAGTAVGAMVYWWHHVARLARVLLPALPGSGLLGVLVLAVWLGLIGGTVEAAVAVGRYAIGHLPTGDTYWGEVFWMAPLAAVASLTVIGMVVVLLDRILRTAPTLTGLAPILLVTLVAFSLLRSLALGIQAWAAALLSLGVAVQLTRAMAKRSGGSRVLVRKTTPWILVAMGAWAVALPAWRYSLERKALAELPEPSAEAPNVLLVIWDTVRAMTLSLYGYDRSTTPGLERLASSSVVFDRAIATSPWTLPSHASIFTGHEHQDHSADWRTPLDDEHRTLAEVLSSEGYAAGGFVGNIWYAGAGFGLDRGFAWYDDRVVPSADVIAHSWWLSRTVVNAVWEAVGVPQTHFRKTAEQVNEAFLDWQSARDERPFFAFLNYFDAHEPYLPPEPFNLQFAQTQPRYWMPWYGTYTADDIAQFTDAYDSCLYYVDYATDRLLEELEARGVLENTIVIVTADHGEEFGEHGADLMRHGRSLYAPVLHVPLLISYPPRFSGGIRRTEPVSIRDIPATILDLAGVSGATSFPGTSMTSLLEGGEGEHASIPVLSQLSRRDDAEEYPQWPAADGPMHSIISDGLHYIRDDHMQGQIFDLMDDPWEANDLGESLEGRQLMKDYELLLDRLLQGG